MGTNWTETLRGRNNGQRAGFAVPRNLDKLNKAELVEHAEARGIATDDMTAKDLAAAIRGS